MRIAIVSDVHGNLTAFEAVLADLRETAPDLVLHGGDLADSGSSPAAVVDHIRDLGWPGVLGNTDQMLADPASLETFAGQAPHLESLWNAVRDLAAAARDALGPERLAWLGGLPHRHIDHGIALVHASPATPWIAPAPEAPDSELDTTYADLGQPIAVYGHIHHPYVRSTCKGLVINTGSVSLSYDGDPRASYLLLDGTAPTIRRVPYDAGKEIRALTDRRIPHAPWIATMLRTSTPALP